MAPRNTVTWWQRRARLWLGRRAWVPFVEVLALVAVVAMAALSYVVLKGQLHGEEPLTPPLVASLLVANLVPAIALIVLIGRRVAKRRALASPVGGGGRLHVRLVGIFSLIASVPMLLVVIFSSLLFQYGVEFWFSQRARGMLENASTLAQVYYQEKQQAVANETTVMAGDIRDFLQQARTTDPRFAEGYAWQVYSRGLSESVLVEIGPDKVPRTLALVDPDGRTVEKRVSPEVIARLQAGQQVVVRDNVDRVEAVTRLYPDRDLYLYASRIADPQALAQTDRAKAVLRDYDSLLDRSRRLQLQFNAALLIISILLIAATVWIALRVADRLVRPVGELVDAARKVAGGDLTARVPATRSQDEVGTLGKAFNRMTARLEDQTGTLENRRALIEAVLSGVSAGVVAVDAGQRVRLLNYSAAKLLRLDARQAVGQALERIAPALAAVLADRKREAVVDLPVGDDQRTLAVRVVRDADGAVLTFDDITERLADQRRAAWADVARRIAHEIKNPLTPIQLAAERIKRRYGGRIGQDDGTFERLTGTIVRQVGDLRRMVDEFSSFARMPKPVFRREAVVDLAREALFLHEVAHPRVRFVLDAPAEPLSLVCDRRQLGQALTNLVKNAVEAIEQGAGENGAGEVRLAMRQDRGRINISVSDTGVGLPLDRERLVEPYMTTRAKGTGLGLAIVKKIVEEHDGTMHFADRAGGGAVVTLSFDVATLAARELDGEPGERELSEQEA